ncbi:MAG: class III signal peptide-containing protein [Candidatus Omnitrophota bacterium]|nr:class III signal peptide-containing protein [Candidatus Omnitrophota bacterium]
MLRRNIKTPALKKKKGQSTLEYIILVAGVIAVLIVFLAPGGIFQTSFNSILSSGTQGGVQLANALKLSHGSNAL